MSDLFARIESVRASVPGWCTSEKAQALAALIIGYRPQTVMEIGVFGGSSFFPMAMAMAEIKSGIVIGVDPWDKQLAIASYPEIENQKWADSIDFEGIHKDFMMRISAWSLNEFCVVERMQSKFVRPPANLGLLHIDGAHNDEAVKDVSRFAYSVIRGGFVVLDDLHWSGGGVLRAEARLLQLSFVKLYNIGSGAVYQKL